MAEVASAYVSLLPSAKGFGSSMDRQISPQLDSSAKRSGGRFGKLFAFSSMGPLRALGVAAAGLFAVDKVGEFFSASIGEAREAQKVGAQTAQVIKTTGGVANVSAKQIGNLASAISLKTGIDDEAIQSGENLLLTFTNIRNETGRGNKIFSQATRIVTDMSSALGQDMKSSAVQVGKALNDPIKGVTALQRVGVSFTAGQKDQIKKMVESGQTMKAQKFILRELNKEFGGSAAATATAGEKMKVAWGNLQEQIGTALLPVLDKVEGAITKRVIPAISGFVDGVQRFFSGGAGDGFGRFADGVQGTLVPAIQGVARVFVNNVLPAFKRASDFVTVTLAPALRGVVKAVEGLVSAALPIVQQFVDGMRSRIGPLMPQVKQIFGQIVGTVRDALNLVSGIVRAVTTVIQFIWKRFGTTIMNTLAGVFRGVVQIVKGALNILQGVIRLVTSVIKGDWGGAWNAIKQIVRGAWQVIGGIVRASLSVLKGMLSAAWTVIKSGASAAWEGVKKAFSSGIKGAVGLAASLPGKVVAAIGELGSLLSSAGAKVIQGFIDGIRSKIGEVEGTLRGLTGKLTDWKGPPKKDGSLLTPAGRLIISSLIKGFLKGEPGVRKHLLGLTARIQKTVLDGLKSMRSAVASQLSSLRSTFTQLRDSIAQTFSGDLFNVSAGSNIWSSAGSLAAAFSAGLKSKIGDLKALKSAFAKLRKWGVPAAFLGQLFASGNGDLAIALANGSRSQALADARDFGQVQTLSKQLGSAVARNQYGRQIDQLGNKLDRIERALHSLPKGFGHEINKAHSKGHRRGKK